MFDSIGLCAAKPRNRAISQSLGRTRHGQLAERLRVTGTLGNLTWDCPNAGRGLNLIEARRLQAGNGGRAELEMRDSKHDSGSDHVWMLRRRSCRGQPDVHEKCAQFSISGQIATDAVDNSLWLLRKRTSEIRPVAGTGSEHRHQSISRHVYKVSLVPRSREQAPANAANGARRSGSADRITRGSLICRKKPDCTRVQTGSSFARVLGTTRWKASKGGYCLHCCA